MKLIDRFSPSVPPLPGRRPSRLVKQRAREKRARDSATAIHATLQDERRPIPGFEEFYEITRAGYVYSKRQRRFIQHKLTASQKPYIGFSINGEKHRLWIRETIERAFSDPST